MGCTLLKPSGLPSECSVAILDTVLNSVLIPFLIWRLVRIRRKPPTAGAGRPRLRELATWLVIIGIFLLIARGSIADAGVQILVLAVHRAERRQRVSLPEIQLWWAQRLLVEVVRFLSVPNLGNVAVAALTASTLLCEALSSPPNATGYEDADIWGRINQSFVANMIHAAKDRILRPGDYAGVPKELDSESVYAEFADILAAYDPNAKYRVLWAMFGAFKWNYFFLLVIDLLGDLVTYAKPLLLAKFLGSLVRLQQGEKALPEAVYFGSGYAAIQLVTSALTGIYSVTSSIVFSKSRSALQECIYRKALALDPGVREQFDTSKVMNLLNVDCVAVQIAFQQIPTLVSAPVGLVLCTVQLWFFIGTSMLAAVPVLLIYVPFTSWITRRLVKRFPETMAAKDLRAKSTLSVIRNIKSLKLYAWEEPYEQQVLRDRENELGVQRKFVKYQALLQTVTAELDNIVAAVVFMAYLYLTGDPLTPQIVFPALSMLSLVSDPLFAFPRVVTNMGRANTAQQRMNEFLRQPEEDLRNFSHDNNGVGVEFSNATLRWSRDGDIALRDANFKVGPGDLCCIVGKVGAGKSAILRAVCGQMFVEAGSVALHTRADSSGVAYCSQEPWLQFRSLRDNILFGLQYDEDFYNEVIDACDLKNDLELFAEGDATEIGEKGIRLSGGQKARVALARAVYSRADIVVLDDVLSAVDEHVSKKLVERIFSPRGLLSGRCIILATNSAKVLSHANMLVLIQEKRVEYVGSPKAEHLASTSLESTVLPPPDFNRHAELAHRQLAPAVAQPERYTPTKVFEDEMFPDVPIFRVFRRYMASTSNFLAVAVLSSMLTFTLLRNLVNIWLTIWSDKNLAGLGASKFYVIVYIWLSVITAIAIWLSNYLFQGSLVVQASTNLHKAMIHNVSRAPMSFFERTALGQVMNRFTGDLQMVDNLLPGMMMGFLQSSFSATIGLAVAIVGAPFIIIIILPLLWWYNSIRVLYVPCSRQLQKLSSAARGPIMSHIEESIKGVGTVSAFGKRPQFVVGFEQRADTWMHLSFLRSSLRRWLNYRVKLLTTILIMSCVWSLIFLVGKLGVAVGVAGIVLHSVQLVGMRLSWIIATWTDLEVSVVAAERIFDYTDMKTEGPARVPDHLPPPNWPEDGCIQFENYSTRFHSDLPDVLKNISLAINAKEKIGVVGRTGAGKSTLTLALFRIIEATQGCINIDNVDTAEIGLYDLRSRLSIIPQDAQIFKGTLRSNLDPLDLNDDARLWQVLELCHLRDHFGDLDSPLSEGGDNISRGQAQLICLGRALLRPGTILVLDEATASVDAHTDGLVQDTIRKEFADRTIITIAHRLNTVMDSDRILVLEKGEVEEFASPKDLLSARGKFWELVQSHKEDEFLG